MSLRDTHRVCANRRASTCIECSECRSRVRRRKEHSMSGLETRVATYSNLELVDYHISQEAFCFSIGVCVQFACNEVCAEACWLVNPNATGTCEGSDFCCNC